MRSPQPGGPGGANPWLIAITVGFAAFMEVLDISIANVALEHIAGSLSASQDESTWVLTSYLVTNAIVLPISGWLASTIGRKRYFLACIIGFSITSLLCGIAPNLAMLIVARGLQGISGGGLQPNSQAILADTFPPAKRGQAFAAYGIAVVFAPAIGPTLGGWITDNFSWRWVFLLNVPVGILLSLLAARVLADPPAMIAERKARRGAEIAARLHRLRAACHWHGCIADRPRQRARGRLVRQLLHHPFVDRRRVGADRLCASGNSAAPTRSSTCDCSPTAILPSAIC